MERALEDRVDDFIARHGLIPRGGHVACLVSGGADSTCLWHVLRALGYRVSAVHVNHGLRGAESEADARFCRETFGASVLRRSDDVSRGDSEARLRDVRYAVTAGRGLRATGHTASDQVETVLYRLVSSGNTRGIKVRREDGVVRPLLEVWRDETEAYCRANALDFRTDSSNRQTKRGLVRERILPLLRELHPASEENLLALAADRPRLPRRIERALVDLLASTEGTRATDLGNGVRAVREYDELRLEGTVTFGPWTLRSEQGGLVVRTRRPGDRIAGRRKKLQDVLVDAKVPVRERDSWPLVVAEEGIVCVPGVVEAPGWEGVVRAWKDSDR